MSKIRSELFLSCDLVGSTNYKQSHTGWQAQFLSFYRQFPQMLGDAAIDLGHDHLTFNLWKPVGDELIFTVVIKHERHVRDAVRAWLLTMARYEEVLSKDKDPGSMSTKGGAFIATFPGPDSESTIPRSPGTETSDVSPILLNDAALRGQRRHKLYLYDYFGPSIDTGFRITSACSPRYFTIAVEVSWALLLACRSHPDLPENRLSDLVFRGPQQFKGVWGGRDYPLFAIDRRAANPINESVRTVLNEHLNRDRAEELCRKCVTSDDWISALYLPESGDEDLRRVPEDTLAPFREEAPDMEGIEALLDDDPSQGRKLPRKPPLG